MSALKRHTTRTKKNTTKPEKQEKKGTLIKQETGEKSTKQHKTPEQRIWPGFALQVFISLQRGNDAMVYYTLSKNIQNKPSNLNTQTVQSSPNSPIGPNAALIAVFIENTSFPILLAYS